MIPVGEGREENEIDGEEIIISYFTNDDYFLLDNEEIERSLRIRKSRYFMKC